MRITENQTLVTGNSRNEIPDPVYVSSGRFSGEINLQWDAVPDARAYLIQSTTRLKGAWREVDVIDEPQYNIMGLEKNKKYYFRVAALFGDRQGEWSEVFFKEVL